MAYIIPCYRMGAVMRKILVTGSNGFIGRSLVNHFHMVGGSEVLGTGIGGNRGCPDIPFEEMDITSVEAVSRVFKQFRPDTVINCAGLSGIEECEFNRAEAYAKNVFPISILAVEANKYKTFFVQLSSELVYGINHGVTCNEKSLPNPPNYYAWTKLMSEHRVRSSFEHYSIIRSSHAYGFEKGVTKKCFPLWVFKSLNMGCSIRVANDQWRSPVFIDDLVSATSGIVRNRISGVYNVSGGDYVSFYEFSLISAKIFNLDDRLIIPASSRSLALAGERPCELRLSIEKIKKSLDYKPTQLETALRILYTRMESDINTGV